MPLPVIADVFRVTWDWSTFGGALNAVNVMHFSAPGKTAAQVLDALDAHQVGGLFDPVSGDANVHTISAQPLDGASGITARPPATPAHWIGGVGVSPVPQVAAIIKLGTGLSGRSNHGRIFLPYVDEGGMLDGIITPAFVTSATGAWVTFLNAMAAAGVALGVASYKHSNWHQVLAVVMESHVGTQRRRNVRP
jgi:hypothetical protein